jgi:nucleoid-associated protein YgaU
VVEAQAEAAKAAALKRQVELHGLAVEELSIEFDDGVASVSGKTASQAEREKVVLTVGNVEGVAQVDDRIEVVKPEPEAVYYTVVPGDTLSKIAETHYGNAMKYPVIFEANRPMLKDPDKIYPGQVLRIPPLG